MPPVIAPSLLQRSFVERMGDHVTDGQFNRLAKNLEGASGITQFLGGNTIAWSGFADTMSGITGAEATLATEANEDNPLSLTTVQVRFQSQDTRERFDRLSGLALAGIGGLTSPYSRIDGPNSLTLRNYTYADISTLGRIGTTLLRLQFRDAMGPNLRGVTQRTIGEIEASDIIGHMPPELLECMTAQKQAFGEAAAGTLLSSSGLSHIGLSMRQTLEGRTLHMQRPKDNRPRIEDNVNFISGGDTIQVSRFTIGHALKHQTLDYGADLIEPFKKRDLVEIGSRIWDIATGLGIKEGILPALRASGTLALVTGVVLYGTIRDGLARRPNKT